MAKQTVNPASAAKTRAPRHRKSCNSCFIAKVKCDKVKPMCGRCLGNGLSCGWSPVSLPGVERTDGAPTSSSKRKVTPNKDSETLPNQGYGDNPYNYASVWLPPDMFSMEEPSRHSRYKGFQMNGAQHMGFQANENKYPSMVPTFSEIQNGMVGSPTQFVAPDDVYTPMPFSSSQEISLKTFSQNVDGMNTPMTSPVMRAAPSHMGPMPNPPWENHHRQDLIPQSSIPTPDSMDFHSPTLGGPISLSPMFPQPDLPSFNDVSSRNSQGFSYDVSKAVSNDMSNAIFDNMSNGMSNGVSNGNSQGFSYDMSNVLTPGNTPGSSHSSPYYGPCYCFDSCLQTLRNLHNISESSPHPIVEESLKILETSRRAIEVCAAALDCPRCITRRKACTQKDTMLLGMIFDQVSSFYSRVLCPNPTGSGPSATYQGPSFPPAYEKRARSRILAVDFQKLEDALAKFRDVSLEENAAVTDEITTQVAGHLANARQALNYTG